MHSFKPFNWRKHSVVLPNFFVGMCEGKSEGTVCRCVGQKHMREGLYEWHKLGSLCTCVFFGVLLLEEANCNTMYQVFVT